MIQFSLIVPQFGIATFNAGQMGIEPSLHNQVGKSVNHECNNEAIALVGDFG